MTKEEYIEHLCDVINAVFKAEDAISKEWQPKLNDAINYATKEERAKIAQEYVHAIAEETLEGYLRSGHTMEEILILTSNNQPLTANNQPLRRNKGGLIKKN